MMEDDHDHDQSPKVVVNKSSGGPPATPRWNPTKEQINMLESLYRQGIRTPSADQIQQITARLRAFGHIEGKNVFYWFQNHKARQRQKQKQESIAYINRFLHKSSNPITHQTFSPSSSHHIPCPNVICGPYYVPVPPSQTDPIGTFHQQYQQRNIKFPVSNANMGRSTVSRTSPRLEKISRKTLIISSGATNNDCTLSLFPLSPTCDLQKKSDNEHNSGDIDGDDHDHMAENINVSHCEIDDGFSSSTGGGGGGDGYKPFYDFF